MEAHIWIRFQVAGGVQVQIVSPLLSFLMTILKPKGKTKQAEALKQRKVVPCRFFHQHKTAVNFHDHVRSFHGEMISFDMHSIILMMGMHDVYT